MFDNIWNLHINFVIKHNLTSFRKLTQLQYNEWWNTLTRTGNILTFPWCMKQSPAGIMSPSAFGIGQSMAYMYRDDKIAFYHSFICTVVFFTSLLVLVEKKLSCTISLTKSLTNLRLIKNTRFLCSSEVRRQIQFVI